jgi:hypothetical protein
MGKYALLIGVDTYGEGLQHLPAASKDVAALREVLLNPQMGGFDEAKPLINPMQPEMAREIELWFQDRQPEDLVLLFFSGHGVKDDRRDLYFAAANTEKRRDRLLTSTAIPARFLRDRILACKAKHQVLILDCCFSGAFGDWVARDDGEISLKEQLGAEGHVVLTSTSAVDYSFEEKGGDLSIYTRYLVEGIVTGAADEDRDGVITVDELHRYAERKVKQTSPIMSPNMITLKGEGFRIRIARSPLDDPKQEGKLKDDNLPIEDAIIIIERVGREGKGWWTFNCTELGTIGSLTGGKQTFALRGNKFYSFSVKFNGSEGSQGAYAGHINVGESNTWSGFLPPGQYRFECGFIPGVSLSRVLGIALLIITTGRVTFPSVYLKPVR